MPDAYHEDLAYIHDAGFGGYAQNAAPILLDALCKSGIYSGLVIDLGCGSGILAAAVSAVGYDVLGFDISQGMLALARKRAPQARFVHQSVWTTEIPSCVAVTAIGEIVNYRVDRGNTDAALRRLFRRVYAALCPGGLFLFDAAGPGRVIGPGPQQFNRDGEDWAVMATAVEDHERRMLTRRITSFRRVGKLYRRHEEVHELRLFPRSELTGQLRKAGFRVRPLSHYGPVQFPPGYVSLLACKPG
jgi:SAM-dependent methyltransferase